MWKFYGKCLYNFLFKIWKYDLKVFLKWFNFWIEKKLRVRSDFKKILFFKFGDMV